MQTRLAMAWGNGLAHMLQQSPMNLNDPLALNPQQSLIIPNDQTRQAPPARLCDNSLAGSAVYTVL